MTRRKVIEKLKGMRPDIQELREQVAEMRDVEDELVHGPTSRKVHMLSAILCLLLDIIHDAIMSDLVREEARG